MATVNVDGNILDQCLGDLNLETSCPNILDTPMGGGQPVLDDSRQFGEGGSINGLNGKGGTTDGTGHEDNGSKYATDYGQNNDSGVGATASMSNDATGRIPKIQVATGHDFGSNFKGKQSFLNLFQNNRVPNEASKLQYIAPPLGKLVLGIKEIDSVETAFSFCLVVYVMGTCPSSYALLNFVKGWGNEVKFTFKENGWIRFQFPSAEVRDRVLNGGPYMIFEGQLFLKNLPSCFMFSKEDMVFFPSWVQIFGLPADCWMTQALSRIASVVGKPLHTDMLTISKKGATYARILVELDGKNRGLWSFLSNCPRRKRY